MIIIPPKRVEEEKKLQDLYNDGYLRDQEMKQYYENVKERNKIINIYSRSPETTRKELKKLIKVFSNARYFGSMKDVMTAHYKGTAYKEIYRQLYPGFRNRLYRFF